MEDTEVAQRAVNAAAVAPNDTSAATRHDNVANTESAKPFAKGVGGVNGGTAGRGKLMHDISGWVGGSIEH